MAFQDDIAKRIGIPPGFVDVGVRTAHVLWAAIPQAQKDKLAAFAMSEARALAGWALKTVVAYAIRRIAEGAPSDAFPNVEDFMRAPPIPMDENASMVLTQEPANPTV